MKLVKLEKEAPTFTSAPGFATGNSSKLAVSLLYRAKE
jgi:hypothetical protein